MQPSCSRSEDAPCALMGCSRPRQCPLGFEWDHCFTLCFISFGRDHEPWCHPVAYTVGYEDSEDDEWPGRQLIGCGVNVKLHGLVTPLGRQLNGCVGTIVRVDTAAKRYGVNVDNFGLDSSVSINPDNLELIILNRARSGG